MSLKFTFIEHLSALGEAEYSAFNPAQPFLHYDFLHALEQQGCVGGQSGWQPEHCVVHDDGKLLALLPLYRKTHSYGEYVFDFAWAEAYQRYGYPYYPKLISAVPFTPVSGPRLLTTRPLAEDEWSQLTEALQTHCRTQGLSSLHWLFGPQQEVEQLTDNGLLKRHSVQFHWFNQNYQHFDDFLARCTARKRKSIKRERRRVVEQDVQVIRLNGNQISAEHITQFYHCYQATYLKRSGHGGYLSHGFFQQLRQTMANSLLLVMAQRNGEDVGAALFLYDEKQLYGRYWGALADIDALHFECCFYQGIEFCIEQGLTCFNPGTQGEHKILRGFEPVWCYSAHWLKEPSFHQAVEQFVEDEYQQLQVYKQQASQLLPYKADQ